MQTNTFVRDHSHGPWDLCVLALYHLVLYYALSREICRVGRELVFHSLENLVGVAIAYDGVKALRPASPCACEEISTGYGAYESLCMLCTYQDVIQCVPKELFAVSKDKSQVS